MIMCAILLAPSFVQGELFAYPTFENKRSVLTEQALFLKMVKITLVFYAFSMILDHRRAFQNVPSGTF